MKEQIFKDTLLFLNNKINEIHQIIQLANESKDSSQLITNGITIFIALIAGLIALYQVKANIISSSRISWIENLRESISSYCVEISSCGTIVANMYSSCYGKIGKELEDEINKFYPEYAKSSNESDKLGYKVKLYLNSSEKSHKKIEELIDKITINLHKQEMSDLNREELEDDLNEIIIISKTIFKSEWEKSKSIFRI